MNNGYGGYGYGCVYPKYGNSVWKQMVMATGFWGTIFSGKPISNKKVTRTCFCSNCIYLYIRSNSMFHDARHDTLNRLVDDTLLIRWYSIVPYYDDTLLNSTHTQCIFVTFCHPYSTEDDPQLNALRLPALCFDPNSASQMIKYESHYAQYDIVVSRWTE